MKGTSDKIYCLLHSRNLRSNSEILKCYAREADAKKDLDTICELIKCIRIKNKTKAGISMRSYYVEEILQFHPNFDTKLERTINDIYWVQECAVVNITDEC